MSEASRVDRPRTDCSTLIRVESAHAEEPLQVPAGQRLHRCGGRVAGGCRRIVPRRYRHSPVDGPGTRLRSRDAHHPTI